MDLKSWIKRHAFAVLLLCVSIPASAQEQEGISLGQFRLLPTIGVSWGHDDNVTFANGALEETTEVSSDFWAVSPGIRLELPSDRSILTVTWQGEYGEYDNSPIDDYFTWSLRGAWDYDPTSRTSLGVFAEWREDRDRRGQGRTQGNLGLDPFDPDEYDLISYGGYFDYGAVGSRGRLEVELARTEREYQNNRDFTRFLDRDDDHFGATFFLRIRPKTSLLVEANWTDIGYRFTIPSAESLDNTEKRIYLGVAWDVSARTSGRIQYGVLDKDFDDPLVEDYDGETWRAAVTWLPRTYSNFTLTATRETDESDGFGDYVLREDISLDWTHQWATRFNTIVEYGVGTDEHQPVFREDDLTYWGVSARWQINQYFQLGLGYQDYERESNEQEFSHERKVWLLTLEGSL